MNLSIVLAALVAVESGGDDHAVGKRGEHGALQIRQCVVTDVNRFAGTRYTLKDTRRRDVSLFIATVYLTHYCGTNATPEVYVRTWNGGPDGPTQSATLRHWKKVQKFWSKHHPNSPPNP